MYALHLLDRDARLGLPVRNRLLAGLGKIDEDEILLERRADREERAVLGHGEAPSIEDQAVVAADQVHVDDRETMLHGDLAEHLLAQAPLPPRIGGGRQVDQEPGPFLRDGLDGVRAIAARAARVLVIPDVLADRHADRLGLEPREGDGRRRLEVAILVEDIVVRKQGLPMNGNHLAAPDHPGLVEERLSRVGVGADGADHEAEVRPFPRILDQERERFAAALDEGGAFEEVARGVAGQRHLGEDGHVGPAGRGARGPIVDTLSVALEISNDGIDLAEGNAQKTSGNSLECAGCGSLFYDLTCFGTKVLLGWRSPCRAKMFPWGKLRPPEGKLYPLLGERTCPV
ncbi:MAG: hypothetical protein FD129_1237 [bacterium]|nr:MAG: hypothetical protein FD129_1237 [bacterium]